MNWSNYKLHNWEDINTLTPGGIDFTEASTEATANYTTVRTSTPEHLEESTSKKDELEQLQLHNREHINSLTPRRNVLKNGSIGATINFTAMRTSTAGEINFKEEAIRANTSTLQ